MSFPRGHEASCNSETNFLLSARKYYLTETSKFTLLDWCPTQFMLSKEIHQSVFSAKRLYSIQHRSGYINLNERKSRRPHQDKGIPKSISSTYIGPFSDINTGRCLFQYSVVNNRVSLGSGRCIGVEIQVNQGTFGVPHQWEIVGISTEQLSGVFKYISHLGE